MRKMRIRTELLEVLRLVSLEMPPGDDVPVDVPDDLIVRADRLYREWYLLQTELKYIRDNLRI